jgi:cytochrome b6-f complex iron-sulfur subunit
MPDETSTPKRLTPEEIAQRKAEQEERRRAREAARAGGGDARPAAAARPAAQPAAREEAATAAAPAAQAVAEEAESPAEVEAARTEAVDRAAEHHEPAARPSTAAVPTRGAAEAGATRAAPAARPAPAPREAAPAAPTPAAAGAAPPMTRREFLYYIWGASMVLLTAQATGAILWFALPRFKAGEFGGEFPVDIARLPQPDSGPVAYNEGKFWLVNVGPEAAQQKQTQGDSAQGASPGVMALYKVCTHLGCLYKWVDLNNRYECPCHGSKFNLNGTWIEGPAPRNLDRFVIRAVDANGNTLAETVAGDPSAATGGQVPGSPIEIPPGTTQLIVDTGARIRGATHA